MTTKKPKKIPPYIIEPGTGRKVYPSGYTPPRKGGPSDDSGNRIINPKTKKPFTWNEWDNRKKP